MTARIVVTLGLLVSALAIPRPVFASDEIDTTEVVEDAAVEAQPEPVDARVACIEAKESGGAKQHLLTAMEVMERERVVTPSGTVSLRDNPISVVVLDPAAVPGEFQRTKIEISVDRRAIAAHYRDTGEIVAGVSIERGRHLQLP